MKSKRAGLTKIKKSGGYPLTSSEPLFLLSIELAKYTKERALIIKVKVMLDDIVSS